MTDSTDRKNIIIIGGGIIGCTTAYFLTRHPSFDPARHTITLLEASKIAGGASGKAGGLLGLWAYPSNIVPLSFRLHAELAKEHGGEKRWGYRRIHVGQLEARGRMMLSGNDKKGAGEQQKQAIDLGKRDDKALGKLRAAGVPKDLDWVAADGVLGYDEMGTPKDTGQVHPLHFTTSMAALAEEKGTKITLGARVKSINRKREGKEEIVESVTYQPDDGGEAATLPATHVVVAAGPWTQRVLPSAPIQALRAHSVTIKPTRELSGYALFTSIQLPAGFDGSTKMRGEHVTPEIYARPFDEIYACGEGDQLVPLPDTTTEVEVDDSRCQDIINQVGSISDELRDGEVTARQACYLPTSGGSGPFIGEMRECKNLILAAGHAVWGIQNGPATGKLVSEIVMEGQAKSAKLGNLDPKRSL